MEVSIRRVAPRAMETTAVTADRNDDFKFRARRIGVARAAWRVLCWLLAFLVAVWLGHGVWVALPAIMQNVQDTIFWTAIAVGIFGWFFGGR